MSKNDRLDLVSSGTVEVQAAIEFTNLPRSTIYDLMMKGRLPYTKVGRRRLIPRVALTRLLEEGLVAVEA